MSDRYRQFLEGKIKVAPVRGFEVDPAEVNPDLKDFVRAIVPVLAHGGRRGLFSRFGMHKTSAQIELARLAMKNTGVVPLIGVPLGVRHEFFEEAETRFRGDCAVKMRFIRSMDEVDEHSINLTNYETLREGKIDPSAFGFVSLDEAAVLRGFGGTKTFRQLMAQFAGDDRKAGVRTEGVKYRFVATATPDPNEYIELLAYAAFLDIMDVGQAKTRFFRRDSEKADRLTLHPHKEREFWLWVASWALFLQRPSDIGFSDDGYELPHLDIRWHEVASDHAAAGEERDGQMRLLRDAARGVQDAAREKRDSLPARVAKLAEIRAEDPQAHRIIWHDLEDERRSIERAIPTVRSIYGSQPTEVNEQTALDFKHGRFAELATKPSMSGAGCNFQFHCHWAVFLGIGPKFHDFIQAIHRLVRYGQPSPVVRLDLIYTEAEREQRRNLEAKWRRHEEQAERMSAIIREYGLGRAALTEVLSRSIGVERDVVEGDGYRLVHNDCVEETRRMEADSVDLIITSIPFSTQYEYTPIYNDFGHTDSDEHFFEQMDFLTPELLRVLKPGRNAVIHVKDRIVPGGINGFGFQTVSPFSDMTVAHFRRHGFAFLARKTIATDVVRENSQTYRLGWSEQCKDGTRMGAGMPEYLLIFRKPPTDRGNGYADDPVVKDKPLVYSAGSDGPTEPFQRDKRPVPGTGYSRGRWQLDAHGYMPSDGNRFLLPDELQDLVRVGRANPDDKKPIFRGWKRYCEEHAYDFGTHVAFAEELDRYNLLPPDFMLIPPHSRHPDVWTDVTRMRTLNTIQAAAGREKHLCPLQFDIVDRVIVQMSMQGETVLDPFGGLMTVPYCAIRLGRRAIGIELDRKYFRDGVSHVEAAAERMAVPTLFDLLEITAEQAA